MKNVTRLGYFLIALLMIMPLSLYAQNQSNDNISSSISVSATVQGSINLTTIRNMNFGDISPGQENVSISPIRDTEAGKMVASGVPESRIRVQYIREWELINSNTGDPLTFYYRVSGSQTDNQETSELLETDNQDLKFNEEGNYYFWIGGRTNISNAQPGSYDGEFTIEIEYI